MSTRRDFIKQTAAASAYIALGGASTSAAGRPVTAGRQGKIVGANDTLRLAIVGVHSRGKAHAKNFAKMPSCEITHLCDCDSDSLANCQEEVSKITGSRPEGIKDYRKLLESNDIDGVVIAMPDHWHALAAIMALDAGKHVYLEKPTSHNPAENEMLLLAQARHPELVITVGNQRRSWPMVREAIEAVQSGEIGKVHFMKSWYATTRDSIGFGKVAPVPANLDWDLWQGPAPRMEYRDNIVHYNWHWFWHWGTGEALNNGTHFVDIMRWGLQVGYPTLVTSVGGRWRHEDDWQAPDSQLITFQFGDRAAGSWEGRSCNAVPVCDYKVGAAFFGDDGAIEIGPGNEYKVLDIDGNVLKDVRSNVAYKDGDTRNPSEELDAIHYRNWFDAIRKGEKLNSTLEEACMSTQLVQLGNIAQRTGHALRIDPGTGKIIGDLAAQKLWAREYEPGWEPTIQ